MSKDIHDLLLKLVEYATSLGAEFIDVRYEDVHTTSIVSRDGVIQTRYGIDRGIAVRVYVEGVLGFAYTSRVSWDALEKAVEKALSMARAGKGFAKTPKPIELSPITESIKWPLIRDPKDISLEEKIKDILEVDKVLASKAYVKSRTIVYRETHEHKLYVSSDGRDIDEQRVLIYVYTDVFAKEADIVASAYRTQGTTKGYIIWDRKEAPEEFANKLLKRVEGQLKAKTPKAGEYPVVFAPEVVGVFIHEAFGHLAEADLVVSGSALQGKIGEKVASEKVTIVDDPTIDDGFGTFKYDDEGVNATKVVIVDKGVLKGYMTDRIHARILGIKPTGNGRAESYRVPPLVRMRNTVMMPGDYKVDELFEDIKFGYYVVATSGGQTNTDGGFQVGVQEAYEIVNGEIGSPVRNMSISGNTLETLLNIDAVANDFKLFYGRCGKGQVVYVSDGGPHVRVKKMTVGGRE